MVMPLEQKERVRPLFFVSAFALAACFTLGGGAGPGFLSEAALEFISVPILFVALWGLSDESAQRVPRAPLIFCAVVAAVALLALAPLPPSIWSHLPGRDPLLSAYKYLGLAPPWGSLNMTPEAGWLSALSLLPALAVFLCALQLNARERRWLTLVALGGALLNALLGLAQISGGPQSPLRLYESVETDATGFLGNRNHLAAILYAATPFAAAWTASASLDDSTRPGAGSQRASLLIPLVGLCAILVLMAGELMARSRAGIALTVAVLVASVALVRIGRRSSSATAASRVILGGAITALFLSNFALYRLAERFVGGESELPMRSIIAENALKASSAVMPVGAGLGSFVQVYPLFEKPRDLVIGAYVNHVHNDFIEIWLETGLVGALLAGVGIFWILRSAIPFWRPPNGETTQDDLLARAASVAAVALLLHSFVDYPLRSNAILAFFAMACAMLTPPVSGRAQRGRAAPGDVAYPSARRARMPAA